MISIEEIKKAYEMAMLSINEDEIEATKEKFISVLEFAKVVEEVDTEGLEPLWTNCDYKSPLRKDVLEESLDRENVLSNTADREFGYIRLRTILSED